MSLIAFCTTVEQLWHIVFYEILFFYNNTLFLQYVLKKCRCLSYSYVFNNLSSSGSYKQLQNRVT